MTGSLRERVTENLSRFGRIALEEPGLRRAAVAATILENGEGRPSFLLTRRAKGLRRHAAQWALPGGGMEPDEDPANAARRELFEEVGLTVGPEAVLGLLDDYPTRSGFLITPVVVWAPPVPALVLDETEVESAHLVPLDELERPDVPRFIEGVDPERPVIQIPLYGRFVHAPTAAILYQLREVGLHGRPTRVAHFDQPTFAWR